MGLVVSGAGGGDGAAMMGREMAQLRKSLRMDRQQFALLIGFTGKPENNATRVKRIEKGREPVPLYIARELWLIQQYIRRTGELPVFPDWDYYVYDHNPDPAHAD